MTYFGDDPTLGHTPANEDLPFEGFSALDEARALDPERFVSESEISPATDFDFEGEWFDSQADIQFEEFRESVWGLVTGFIIC